MNKYQHGFFIILRIFFIIWFILNFKSFFLNWKRYTTKIIININYYYYYYYFNKTEFSLYNSNIWLDTTLLFYISVWIFMKKIKKQTYNKSNFFISNKYWIIYIFKNKKYISNLIRWVIIGFLYMNDNIKETN